MKKIVVNGKVDNVVSAQHVDVFIFFKPYNHSFTSKSYLWNKFFFQSKSIA